MDFSFQMKPSLRPVIAQAMQQAFHVLQMPLLDLREWLQVQIEQNPVLEHYDEKGNGAKERLQETILELNFERSQFEVLDDLDPLFVSTLFPDAFKERKKVFEPSYKISFYTYLETQIKSVFSDPEELKIALFILQNLDEKGFITLSFEDLCTQAERALVKSVLNRLQEFEPSGIFAFDLKNSLLLQLRHKGKQNSLAFKLIEHSYEDLLHNRIPLVQKKLKCSQADLQNAIKKEIAHLEPNPLRRFNTSPTIPLIPDIVVTEEGEKWRIEVKETFIPQVEISSRYLTLLKEGSLEKEESSFLRKNIASGRWLKRILLKRKGMLEKLAAILIDTQKLFLSGLSHSIFPMNMQEVAIKLQVHESTVARAISQKFIECPAGVFPLRAFFNHKIKKASGEEISNQQVKNLLLQLVREEDKKTPYSDQALSTKIQKLGIPCSRRTVTKYRKSLKLSCASKRKSWL